MKVSQPTRRRGAVCAALTAAAMLLGARAATGAEIRVLSAGAAKTAVTELAQAFHAHTGDKAVLAFATVGAIKDKLAAGETPDVVIVSREAAEELERDGRVVPGVKIDLGQVRVGLAVKEGAPLPDISTPEALKKALLAARSVAYVDPAKGGTSGIHFARVLEQLGIAGQVKDKARLVPGGSVADLVARGEAEFGVQQIPELEGVPGVQVVGPLPESLQKITTYTGCIVPHTPVPQEATRFLRFLAGSAGRARFAAAGFTPPAAR